MDEKDIFIRTSTETRTFQVAGGVLVGMDPAMEGKQFPVTTQPAPVSVSNAYTRYLLPCIEIVYCVTVSFETGLDCS